jgi:biotin transport system substrate-specific component
MLQEIPKTYPKTRGIALSALFAVLLSVFSLISIPLPFTVVPVTLQVFMIYLIVNLLGSYYGALSCVFYLLLGAIGLPVFAGGTGGVAVLAGPLGGFLFAFPVSVIFGGMISGKVSSSSKMDAVRVIVASVVSLAIIYIIGPLWLDDITNMGISRAYLLGAVPFIPVDIVKAIFAVPVALYFRRSRNDLPVHRRGLVLKAAD